MCRGWRPGRPARVGCRTCRPARRHRRCRGHPTGSKAPAETVVGEGADQIAAIGPHADLDLAALVRARLEPERVAASVAVRREPRKLGDRLGDIRQRGRRRVDLDGAGLGDRLRCVLPGILAAERVGVGPVRHGGPVDQAGPRDDRLLAGSAGGADDGAVARGHPERPVDALGEAGGQIGGIEGVIVVWRDGGR